MYSKRQPRKPIYDAESGVPPTEAQVARMKKQADNVAAYWLDQRRMTVSELRAKLEKKKLTPEVCDAKVAQLLESGDLNDKVYAEDFVYFKQEFMSERRMRAAMIKKGLAVELVDEALENVDLDEVRSGAERVANRRARATVKEQNAYKRRNKVMLAVISKGYDRTVAESVVNEALEAFPVEDVELEEDEDERSDEERAEAVRAEALALAESKARATRSKTDQNKRLQSIIQSLMRRGYPFSLSREVAVQALSEFED